MTIIRGDRFTVKESKFDFFFGRVTSTPRNKQRSLNNLNNLKKLGIEERSGGAKRLLKIFSQGLNALEVVENAKITSFGVNVARKVEISRQDTAGAIIVYYFYPGGDLDAIPEVTSLIALICK